MLTENQIKEQLSIVYVKAVATIAHFAVESITVDMDSVDVTIRAKGKLAPESIDLSPLLDIQLKATQDWEIQNGTFKFVLPIKNYRELSQPSTAPRLLVVLLLPKDEKEFLKHSSEELCLRNCAYYHNLKGAPEKETKNITVTISTDCIFTPDKLKALMVSISKREPIV